MRYFRRRNINCVPFYEVITRRGIMGRFSKVKGTLEGVFSLIMRTRQKAAKETSHRLCLRGQLFKVSLPCRLIASGLGKQSCRYMNKLKDALSREINSMNSDELSYNNVDVIKWVNGIILIILFIFLSRCSNRIY